MAGELLRDSAFITFFGTLLADSWAHAETRTQATTWGLVLHTLFFGSSSERLRSLLHGPSFFYAHSVLAGWLQLTYANPQIDRDDKKRLWGMSERHALLRTAVVHVLTVVVHHALLRVDGAPRGRRGASWAGVLLRDVGPQLALLLAYKRFYYDLAKTYGITSMTTEALHKWQIAVIAPLTLAAASVWRGALQRRLER
jgi:hypothetical protein